MHPLLAAGQMMIVPGAYDVLSAKLAQRAGFPAVVLSGYAMSASMLGEPDFGLLTQTEVLDVARRVCLATDLAVIVDGDTGYGGPLNVERLVHELLRMGAKGVLLEDQQWPKRCGHMQHKSVIPAEEHAEKIRMAVDTRGDGLLAITARTDAIATDGLDEAIRRAKLYKEAGADVLFVEGPQSKDDLRRIGAELPPPLAVNLIEGGQTPMASLEELHELGFFSVGYVLSPLYSVAKALERVYGHLRQYAETASLADSMLNFEEFADVIGLEQRYAKDAKYAPKPREGF